MTLRASAVLSFLGITLFGSSLSAGNSVTWSIGVGAADAPATDVTLPAALFKDHVLPLRDGRWRCLADKFLRQDEKGNTFSTMLVHCTDGETTISSSASCQIGANDSDRLSLRFEEKSSTTRSAIEARCHG